MNRTTIAALALLCATQAQAQDRCAGIQLPPPGYDLPIIQLPSDAHYRSINDIPRYCTHDTPCQQVVHSGQRASALRARTHLWTRDGWLIGGLTIMPPLSDPCYARINRHERAHIRAWPMSHPMCPAIWDGRDHPTCAR